MSQKMRFIDFARLNEGTFTFSIPKKVRKILKIDKSLRILSFVEEPDGEISIGFGGERVIGTSKFFTSYQVTLTELPRAKLKVEKGYIIAFYQTETNKIIIKKQE